jgi:putative PIN family toxin of toxin-antitoxin system
MRIVLDTNVLISGLISASDPSARAVDLWVEGAVQVVVSPPIVSEHFGVFLRPKFEATGTVGGRQEVLERLISLPNTLVIVPEGRVICVGEDPSDDRFLECAKAGRAGYIVSGDEHLLSLGVFEGIPIVNPGRFIEMMKISLST